ncbi:MAG: 2-oxoacid:acceptor oxidoreductase subunit alpha, partial [Flavobacteriales bacterium]|nr:2-oxoacid:acceptor oxidoreductase subunit alpha [Flavobacteriales bacterium]
MNKNYLNKVVIKFAGDSGDGIQLLGNKFSDLNIKDDKINDIYTLVEFPPEIRAPAGSISGISSFQISISSEKIYNTGNDLDILIAFNPAALKLN